MEKKIYEKEVKLGNVGKRKVRRSEDKRKVGREAGRMREADVVERWG